MSHTPGPWIAKRARTPSDGGYDYGIAADVGGGAVCIAEAFEVVGIKKRCQADANAKLIAAAPDLLTALDMLLQDVQDYPAWQRPCAAVDMAKAALAKARGEST